MVSYESGKAKVVSGALMERANRDKEARFLISYTSD
jgi:hypothetical protein